MKRLTFPFRQPLCLCVFLAFASPVAAEEAEKPAPQLPPPAEIKQLVADLGSGKYAVREEATKKLLGLSEGLAPYLADAVNSPDPEVKLRARQIMSQLGAGEVDKVDPKIKAEVDALIEPVMGSGHANLDVLVQSGKRVVPALVAICKGADNRKAIYSMIALTRIADPRSFPALADMFQNPQLSRHMSGYMSQIKDPRMLFHMIKVWQSKKANASLQLRSQVKQMSGEDLGDDPDAWMKWFNQKYGDKLGAPK